MAAIRALNVFVTLWARMTPISRVDKLYKAQMITIFVDLGSFWVPKVLF